VRLSDSTREFPILKTTKTLIRNSLMYMSKASFTIAGEVVAAGYL